MKLTQVTAMLALRNQNCVVVAKNAETTMELDWASVFGLLYRAYYASQSSHWNTRGENFNQDHVFFQTQYEKLAELVDTVAEHIRTYDVELPERLSSLSNEPATTPLGDAIKYRLHYASSLIVILPKLFSICRAADATGDDASANLGQSLISELKHLVWLTASGLPEELRLNVIRELRTVKTSQENVKIS